MLNYMAVKNRATITSRVLERIRPSAMERKEWNVVVDEFLLKLNKGLVNATAIVGGSGAKDTWLAGNADIDVFVRYDHSFSLRSGELADLLEKVLAKMFSGCTKERVHGSRDYFKFEYGGLSFEVVPILNISTAGDAVNITDVSPLHTKWVNKNGEGLKDEIRLAKQFCKAQGVYGAESYINGFSGYVLEILVIYYGGFEKLLKASAKWKLKDVIDIEKYYKGKNVLFELNKSKLQSAVIVIDPVDKVRNASAALGVEKCKIFQQKAKEYLLKPEENFFVVQKVTFEGLQKEAILQKLALVYIECEGQEGKEDVVGTKLLKVFEFLREELGKFIVVKSGWQWRMGERGIFYFLLKLNKIDDEEIIKGPPLRLASFVLEFKKKHRVCFEEKGVMYAREKVEFTGVEEFVKDLLKKKYVEERVEKIVKVRVI